MKNGLFKSFKKYVLFLTLRYKNKSSRRVFSTFAKKVGLVYFGFVNQHTDDHKIIRGLTVSPTHQDNNYSVGTVDGYNLSIVDRTDYIVEPDGSSIFINWVIFAFELHSETAVPHFFLDAKNRSLQPFRSLFSTFPNMKEVDLGQFDNYGVDFTSRFDIYARPAKSVEVQNIISIDVSRVIGAHFWPLSVEQQDSVLYLYSTFDKVNPELLNKLLKCGLWLAGQLDKQTESED